MLKNPKHESPKPAIDAALYRQKRRELASQLQHIADEVDAAQRITGNDLGVVINAADPVRSIQGLVFKFDVCHGVEAVGG